MIIFPMAFQQSQLNIPLSHTLLLTGNYDVQDYSGTYKNAILLNNVSNSSGNQKYGVGGLSFNGSDSRVYYDGDDFNFGTTEDFTIEGWVWDVNEVSYQPFVSFGGQSHFVLKRTSTAPHYWYFFDGTNSHVFSPLNVSTEVWKHIAVERYNGTLNIYYNGVLGYSDSNFSLQIGGSSYDLKFGYAEIVGEWFNGYMDDISVADYARYRGRSFTPRTSAYPIESLGTNKMRDGSVSSIAQLGPGWTSWTPSRVNDGIKQSTPYGLTGDDSFGANEGVGVAVTFNSPLALRRMILYGYALDHADFNIQYWDGGSWVSVHTRQQNLHENSIDAGRIIQFNHDGAISSTQWRWRMINFVSSGSNFYAQEVEAYE